MGQFKHDLERGIALCRGEDYKAAIEVLEKIFNADDDIESGYYLGLSYAQVFDYDKALSVFDNILKRLKDPLRIMQTHILLGYIYTTKEMYDLAEFELIEATTIGVDNPQAYSALGYVYFKKGEFRVALVNLQKAIELNPKNANARNTLGYILAENGNLDEAIVQVRKALEIDHNNPAYLDSLGWAYFLKNDYFNARRFLLRAFELAPDSKDIKEHLIRLEEEAPNRKTLIK